METRSLENIGGLGADLTPELPPLAFSLSDPFLHSHCSSCFHPLPSTSTPTPHHHHNPHPAPIRYCSLRCSHLDSPPHFTTAEHHLFLTLQSHSTTWHSDTSDLRTALRLLHHFTQLNLLPPSSHNSDRIGGLLTNHEKLKQQDEVFTRIREGARLMSLARNLRDGRRDFGVVDTVVEEMVLCAVLTNAVEVQVNETTQGGLGVAVYGPSFSWINHSCAPNACYRFSLFPSEPSDSRIELKMQISAFGDECVERNYENGICGGYGPRIVVRSIKPTKKGEEVFVTYTDLLQPKATRHLELWSRYAFVCCCWRCSASPPTYVDCVLHGNIAAKPEPTNSTWDHNLYKDDAYEELCDCMDEIISEYLSTGNPECCCDKLENMLIQSPKKEQLQPDEQSWPVFKLRPLHHLSLSAYITLASAYKIRSCELLSPPSLMDSHRFEAFKLSRTSAAYSLLLAGAVHHLFLSEHSLMVSAVHFWISAGESLLSLARSLTLSSNLAQRFPDLSVSTLPSYSRGKCSLTDRLEDILACIQSQFILPEVEFQEISKGFLDCASRLSSRVWPFLIQGRRYFEHIKDPIDFGWLEATANFTLEVSHAFVSNTCMSSFCANGGYCGLRCETQTDNDEERKNVFQLGAHCLLYGGYLAGICYGWPCYWTNYVMKLLEVKTEEVP